MDERIQYHAVRFLTGRITERQLEWWIAMENLDGELVYAVIDDILRRSHRALVSIVVFVVFVSMSIPWFLYHLFH